MTKIFPDESRKKMAARRTRYLQKIGWVAMERLAILGLRRQLSSRSFYRLVEGLGSPQAAWNAGAKELDRYCGLSGPKLERFERFRDTIELEDLEAQILAQGIQYITYKDDLYPRALQVLRSGPPLLFYKGNSDYFESFSLAVVGTRYPSSYGQLACVKLVGELAKQGITIVSGMARGIDGIAHQTALEHKGSTIAVLGTGVDICYPKENFKLYQQISQRGLIVSEYFPGQEANRWHFPERNRVIAGLCQGLLLVEARARSGSLITVQHALENNREVFCLPGDIFRPESYGGNRLIQQGAKLVMDTNSILEEFLQLDWKRTNKGSNVECNRGISVADGLLSLIGYEPVSVDYLLASTGYAPQTILTELTMLEIEGKIISLPGQRFVKSAEQLSLNLGI